MNPEYYWQKFCENFFSTDLDVFKDEIYPAFWNYHGSFDCFIDTLRAIRDAENGYQLIGNYLESLNLELPLWEITLDGYTGHLPHTTTIDYHFKGWLSAHMWLETIDHYTARVTKLKN